MRLLPSSPRSRTGTTAAAVLAVVSTLVLVSCQDAAGPEVDERAAEAEAIRPQFPLGPVQVSYSLAAGDFQTLAEPVTDPVETESRWCSAYSVWFAPAVQYCQGRGQPLPFGQVTTDEEGLLLIAPVSRAAPFIWTGPPGRENPFPEEGDFTVDVRMKVEQLGGYGTGLFVLAWDPASTEGSNSPLLGRVLQVWADKANPLRVMMPGATVDVSDPMEAHAYRLVYEDGAYTLFVDEEHVAGPVPSTLRPTAVWMGNPIFVPWPGEWTDLRISQFTVSGAAEALVEVPVDVKPGSCPTPFNLKGRGVLPVAIAGTAELDVSTIDPSTLRLDGVAPGRYAVEDVTAPSQPFTGKAAGDCTADGPDGMDDLTVKFPADQVAAAISDTPDGESRTLTLTGNLLPEFGGTAIVGEDVVVVRKK